MPAKANKATLVAVVGALAGPSLSGKYFVWGRRRRRREGGGGGGAEEE